jgi:sugar diacid utilization regulator
MMLDCKSGFLWDTASFRQKEKLVRSLEQILKKYYETSIVFTKSDQIVVLLANVRKRCGQNLAEEICAVLETNKQVAIGLGREVPLREIADSYREATEAVSYCKSLKNKSFVTYSELGVERLWLNTDRSLLDKFVADKIGLLLQMEPEYLSTMQTFISHNKSHKKTAALMHIHPNTLTYRLKKIEKELHVDFNRKEDWINMVLAFQIFEYLSS